MDKNKDIFSKLVAVAVLVTGIPAIIVLWAIVVSIGEAFVFMKLWNWLVSPVFSVTEVTFFMSFIVAFTAGFVFSVFGDGNYRVYSEKKPEEGRKAIKLEAEAKTVVLEKVIKLVCYLFVGWVIHILFVV